MTLRLTWILPFLLSLAGRGALAQTELPLQQEVREALSRWGTWVDHEKLRSVRLRVECETPARGGLSEGTVIRKGDAWRMSLSGENQKDRMHTRSEDIHTDQHLHLQAAAPMDQELKVRGSGQVERTSTGPVPPALGRCAAQLFFGFCSVDASVSIPHALLSSPDLKITQNGSRVIAAATSEHGSFQLNLDRNAGLIPRSVMHSSPSGEVIDFVDIEWDLASDPPVPIAYTAYRDLRVRIIAYDLDARIDKSELLPISDFPDGSFVRASDVPVDCEWRDGRIVPKVVDLDSATESTFFGRSSIGRVVFMGLAGIALAAGALWLYRRERRAS